jgi:hypothetical protein
MVILVLKKNNTSFAITIPRLHHVLIGSLVGAICVDEHDLQKCGLTDYIVYRHEHTAPTRLGVLMEGGGGPVSFVVYKIHVYHLSFVTRKILLSLVTKKSFVICH